MAAQPLNSSIQPTDVYGGDEVSAIVLDPGFSSVRAGFAGEDLPKCFVNSHYGVSTTAEGKPYIFGDDYIHNPNVALEIKNPMSKDGTVEDWDVASKLWEYAITSRLTNFRPTDPRKNGLNDDIKDEDIEAAEESERALEEHPLILTETAWNNPKSREKSIELAMESWACPAFWLQRNAVLAAFGAGKSTALVVDLGASTTSVICIHDGLILKKSIQKSPLAGNWISSQLRSLFDSSDPKTNLMPHYMINSKTPVDAGAPAQAAFRPFKHDHTESFRALEEERVLLEFKESVVQTWPSGRLSHVNQNGVPNSDYAKQQPTRPFEMPDGSNQMWGSERFSVVEGLWDASAALPVPNVQPVVKAQTLPEMLRASINAVDVDLRAQLLQNVVVTGGTSLINGFTDRLHNELVAMFPGVRVKLQAAGLTAERRFGSWLGGSIVGSLGTFHQMWVSRQEYEELGASVVEKRCK